MLGPSLRVPASCLCVAGVLFLAVAPASAQFRKLNGFLAPVPDAEGGARIFEWAFTPDGTRVVYRADPDRTGSTRLYGAPTDGSALATRLSTRQAFSFELSPDGRSVAFLESGGVLDVMPSDGSAAPIRLPTYTTQYEFTSDGTRVVAGGNDLRVVSVDGSSSWIVDPTCCGFLTFQLSTDGSQVLYVMRQGPPGGISQVLWHAWVDGRSPPTQVSGEMGVIEYGFSPDGTRALYREANTGASNLYAARLDGAPSTSVLAPYVRQFTVSHDSTRVVFTSWPPPFASIALFAVSIDGGEAVALSGALVAGGNVEGAPGERAFVITADDSQVVYRADQEVDGVFTLHAVPLRGRSRAVLVERDGVERFAVTADGAEVVFESRASAAAPLELFSAPLGFELHRRSTFRASTAATRLSGPMPAGGGLVDFAPRPDSLGVVYTARQDSLAVELFSAPIDGSSPALKLNPPLVEHGDVEGLIKPAFRIDPTSRRVVYRADQVQNELHELFSVPVEGGAALRVHAPLTRGPTRGSVGDFRFVGSDQVLFRAQGDTAGVTELYHVALAGGSVERLNAPLNSGAYVSSEPLLTFDGHWLLYETLTGGYGYDLFRLDLTRAPSPVLIAHSTSGYGFTYLVTPDAQRVVFQEYNPIGVSQIYSQVLDGSAAPVQLSAARARDGRSVFRLTPDGERIVYSGFHESNGNRELFSAPVDGHAPPVKISGPFPPWGSVAETDFGKEAFRVGPSGRWTAFIAEREAYQHWDLYGVPALGGETPVRLNAKLLPGGDVYSFAISPQGDRLVYLADQDVNNRIELYSASLFGAPHARGTRDGTSLGRVKLNGPLVHDYSIYGFAIAPLGDRVVYNVRQVGDLDASTYIVPIDGSAPARRLGVASSNWRFTPDGRRLLYCAPEDNPNTYELFSVLLDGSQPPVKLNPTLPPGQNVRWYGFRGESSLQLTPDGRKVVYQADQTVRDRQEIYAVPVDGSGPAVVVNGPLAAQRDVGGLDSNTAVYRVAPDGREVVYLADHDENDILELYAAPLP